MPAMTFGRRRTAAFKALKCWIFWKLVKKMACQFHLVLGHKWVNLQETEKQPHTLKGTPNEHYHKTHARKSFITPH